MLCGMDGPPESGEGGARSGGSSRKVWLASNTREWGGAFGDAALRHHPQPPLHRLTPRPTHPEPHAISQLHLVIPARTLEQRVHEIESHDGRAMNAHEARGIEPLLECLHRFADHVLVLARV